MMIACETLVKYLDDYLACDRFSDYSPNGLQVQGRRDIKRICTAVTASLAVITEAAALNADALLVHHGYFWRGEETTVVGMTHQRIRELLINDINLFAYHLPLDCHAVLGNNACLGKLFELDDIQMHRVSKTPNLLWSGRLRKVMTERELSDFLSQKLDRQPLCVSGSTKSIHTLAWCSGGAQDYIVQAHELGVDAYLSGEISERTYYQAHELGLYYFACGHHATERLGIQALGQHLAVQFGFEHQFIDSENPV